jgi:hypothetical protein
MLIYEIGYGGRPIEVTPTRISIRTLVMSCVDTTIFEGSEEEMIPLLSALGAYFSAVDTTSQEEMVERIIELTGGNALLVTMGSGLIMGREILRRIFLMALGIQAERLSGITDEQLVPVAELIREGHSVDEVQGLLN